MCLGSVNMDIIHKVPGYDHIYAYKSFLDEFDRLFKNDKASLKRYKKSLARRLAMLIYRAGYLFNSFSKE